MEAIHVCATLKVFALASSGPSRSAHRARAGGVNLLHSDRGQRPSRRTARTRGTTTDGKSGSASADPNRTESPLIVGVVPVAARRTVTGMSAEPSVCLAWDATG
jgi:hypothetical protein